MGLRGLSDFYINGKNTIPHTLNISFDGVDGETLLTALRQIACSTGSACVSTSVEPSYVLRNIGVSDPLAYASIRFSFGRFNHLQEVKEASEIVKKTVSLLRS